MEERNAPEASTERPAFRGALDTARAEQGGQTGVVLYDRLGLTEGPVFIPEGLLPVVALFDGARSVTEIETELRQQTGQDIPEGFVAGVVAQLDERLILYSERFRTALTHRQREFLDLDVRPVRHAGSAGYPSTPDALLAALDSIVRQSDPAASGNRHAARGLVAPHIDLARGREGYAMAYGWLAEREPADLYVVFGTGHQGPNAPITGLAMDWQTPLGTVRTDRDFIGRVHDRLGPAMDEDVFLHRDEHSIEFQMVFLQHVLAKHVEQGHDFSVAGFLCGQLPTSGGDVLQESYLQDILGALRETSAGRKVCFVAGADLSHLGPFFGDKDPIDGSRLQRLEQDERQRLSHLQAGQVGTFHHAVEGDGNPDRICGTTPMTLVAALANGPAELLHYGQAPAPDGHQVVSFCAMGW